MKKAAKDKKLKEAMIVTNADKKGNTKAYQNIYKDGETDEVCCERTSDGHTLSRKI